MLIELIKFGLVLKLVVCASKSDAECSINLKISCIICEKGLIVSIYQVGAISRDDFGHLILLELIKFGLDLKTIISASKRATES